MLNFIFLILGVGGAVVSAWTLSDPIWKYCLIGFFTLIGSIGLGLIIRDSLHQTSDQRADLVLHDFRVQIQKNILRITLKVTNTGQLAARAIKIEMQAGIGPIPAPPSGTPVQAVFILADDLAPQDTTERTLEITIPDMQLAAVRGKPFGCLAAGQVVFKGGEKESVPFNYWVLRKPGEDLSKITPMVRPPT